MQIKLRGHNNYTFCTMENNFSSQKKLQYTELSSTKPEIPRNNNPPGKITAEKSPELLIKSNSYSSMRYLLQGEQTKVPRECRPHAD